MPNALSAGFGELTKEELTEIISVCGHSTDIRGEKLTVEDFTRLSDGIFERIQGKK